MLALPKVLSFDKKKEKVLFFLYCAHLIVPLQRKTPLSLLMHTSGLVFLKVYPQYFLHLSQRLDLGPQKWSW